MSASTIAAPRLGPGVGPRLGSRFATELPELAVSWQAETAPAPEVVVLNDALAEELGLDPAWLRSEEGVRFLVGGLLPEGARPVAQGYAGHQFGGYSPRLGDGRALLLGELVDRDGVERDLHLKGSGATPFSRGGDGRAVLAPMLREYTVSEAMHALGVPTTRALAVVATGRAVPREGAALPGAVLVRVASSHLRVGSFQYARALEAAGHGEGLLERLVHHAAARHHPEAAQAPVPALALFEAVRDAQADLVAGWMHLGFVHGVMNTDNVTISGETIDYGPCAFLDAHDPATVFSSIDTGGRYAYGQQPAVMGWDLARFAESLLPLLDDDQDRAVELATDALAGFGERYATAYADRIRPKLGLRPAAEGGPDEPTLRQLAEDLLELQRESRVDHTGFWRDLARETEQPGEPGDSAATTPARDRVLDLAAYDAWAERWRALRPDPELMRRSNPAYVPRNHLLEDALEVAGRGGLGPVERMLEVVAQPYDERAGLERYREPASEGAAEFVTFCGT